MEVQDLVKKVRKIEIQSKKISDHLFSGEYHSAFKGKGMSFSEVREYVPGDEIRSIDWNVTARTGTPHVKIFEEERELTVMLLVDISESTQFGSLGMYRRDLILELAAVLAFSANNNNDKVGLLLFSDQIELYIPPKKGKKHSLRLISEIIRMSPASQKTDLNIPLDYISRILKKKAICFLISDMISPAFENALKRSSKRHDVIGLWCLDPLEMQLPDKGLIQMVDAETGKKFLIDSSSPTVRKLHEEQVANRFRLMKRNFAKQNSSLIELPADRRYVKKLLQFFSQRSHV